MLRVLLVCGVLAVAPVAAAGEVGSEDAATAAGRVATAVRDALLEPVFEDGAASFPQRRDGGTGRVEAMRQMIVEAHRLEQGDDGDE